MTNRNEQRSPIGAIIAASVILILLGAAGLWFVLSTVTVGGGTTTPSGAQVTIISKGMGGFGTASSAEATEINIAGHLVEFDMTSVKVDGAVVGSIDESAEKISVTGSKGEVEITVDGKPL